jgi:hypothetical protein
VSRTIDVGALPDGSAGAMVCAFAGLAWVRSHFPAIGKVEANGAIAP